MSRALTMSSRMKLVSDKINSLQNDDGWVCENFDLSSKNVSFSYGILPILVDPRIKPNEKIVYQILVSIANIFVKDQYSDHKGLDRVWISQSTIGNMINVNRSQVNKIIKSLCEKGLIYMIPFKGENSSYIPLNPHYTDYYGNIPISDFKNPNYFLVNFNQSNGFGHFLENVCNYKLRNEKGYL